MKQFATAILVASMPLVTTSCIGYMIETHQFNRKAENWHAVSEGEEASDFYHFTEWVSGEGGSIPLESGTVVHWYETQEYRCYSNDTFTLVFSPRQFHEDFCKIVWIAGEITNSCNFITDLYPFISSNLIGVQTGNIRVAPERCRNAGAFSARFGDSRERLLEIVRESARDSSENSRQRDAFEKSLHFKHRVVYEPCPKTRNASSVSVDFRLDGQDRLYWMEIGICPGSISMPNLFALRHRHLPIVRSGQFKIERTPISSP